MSFYYRELLLALIDKISEFEENVALSEVNKSIYQATLNLLDNKIKNLLKLSREKYNFEYCFNQNKKSTIGATLIVGYSIVCLFHNYEQASKLIDVSKVGENNITSMCFNAFCYLCNSLVASSAAKNEKIKDKHIKNIKRNILKLE